MNSQRMAWLSLTPEPERDLPSACATLRAHGHPTPAQIHEERARAAQMVLHGNRRSWLRFLDEAAALVPSAAPTDPELQGAASVVAEVVLNHHRLLAGFPGPAYERSASERARLQSFLETTSGTRR